MRQNLFFPGDKGNFFFLNLRHLIPKDFIEVALSLLKMSFSSPYAVTTNEVVFSMLNVYNILRKSVFIKNEYVVTKTS